MRYIPRELLNIILDYDGRIKCRKGEYVNIIHKHDDRFMMIEPLINKKLQILKTMESDINRKGGFYFDFSFDGLKGVYLCYDYNFSWPDRFEICYVDLRNGYTSTCQIRTFL